MNEFRGKVAVVTGAASGIGRAMAERFGAEGMKIVLADVEGPALQEAVKALGAKGVEAHGVRTDVTKAEDVDALAAAAQSRFGMIHVVCNNAGVFTGGLMWTAPVAEWEWLVNVNVWGVVHGIRTFVPILLEQGEPAHIVNTASMAAVTAMPYAGIYHMTKHAVLGLSECLFHELASRGDLVKVSALCPEFIATRIHEAERNRPANLEAMPTSPEREIVLQAMHAGIGTATPPAVIAERVFQAIRDERFYILADDQGWTDAARTRCEDIQLRRNPTFVVPMA